MRPILAAFSVFLVMFLYGCGGGLDSNSGSGVGKTAPPGTYSISGQVTLNGVGLSGATVTVASASTGILAATAQTDANGNFTITNFTNGKYFLSAAMTGYTMSPNQPVTVSGANVGGIVFIATAATYSISGQVTLNGAGLSGATVTVASATTGIQAATGQTDSHGNFTFINLANGMYFLSAALTGYAMSPTQPVTVNSANVSGIVFTATAVQPATYSISGQVTLNGDGLRGVTVTAASATTGILAATAQTNPHGNFTLTNLTNGTYFLSAAQTGYTMSPNQPVTVNSANVSGMVFTATAVQPATYSISGQVTLNGVGLSGATVTMAPAATGIAAATAQTDSNGNFGFINVANGTYTLLAAMTGYAMSSNQSVTVNSANVSGIVFTATAVQSSTYSISGQVTLNGVGLSGATVTVAPAATGIVAATAQTDSKGNFTFINLTNGTYTLSAVATGYTMSPNQPATVNNANVSGMVFTATAINPNTYVVDTFQGTGTTTPLQNHIGDSGAGWQILRTIDMAYIDGPNSAAYSSSDSEYYNTMNLQVNDYSVIATVHMNTPASGTNCYISGRINPKSRARYIAGHTQGLGWGLYYLDGTGNEALLSPYYGQTTLSANTSYALELRIVGTSIMMFVNNVLAGSATESSLSSGFAGLETNGTGPGTSGSYELGNYEVTSPSVR